MGGGKRKGSSFERKTMRQIILAFAKFNVASTDAFRSILSGGHKESFGDISLSPALAKLFPFSVECKHWRVVDIYQNFCQFDKMGKACKLKKWWQQTLEGAKKSGQLKPLLVFKSNNKRTLCMGYSHDILPAVCRDGKVKNVLKAKRIPHMKNYVQEAEDRYVELICFPFETLLRLLRKKHGALHRSERNRVRLRSSNSKSQKQMQTSARAQRKVGSVR